MLPLQFFGQNFHFAVSLAAALVFFAVFWLYLDAWLARREAKEFWKWTGFLLVSVSFLLHSTVIEQAVLGRALFGDISDLASMGMRLVGYVLVIIGLAIDPLQAIPDNRGLELNKDSKNMGAGVGLNIATGLTALLPLAAFGVAALYWRRATTGLERHLKPMAIAIGIVAVAELLHVATLWQNTDDPVAYNILAPFGPVWIVEHLTLAAGTFLAGRWVWQYLTKRLESQLFMILTGMVMGIYLLTTVSFTFLMLQNIQRESLTNLETAGKVLQYALDSKKSETKANSEVLAQDHDVLTAVVARDHDGLVKLTDGFLEDKHVSDVVVTNESGQVLLRGADPDRWGDSQSGDGLIKRALIGIEASSVISKQGVLTPQVFIASVTPIRNGSQIVGSVTVSILADNAFLDGIKKSTGLDSAVYSGDVRSATTFVSPDGKSRWVGVKEKNSQVVANTLKGGRTYKGALEVSNRSFLSVFSPLKDVDNNVVGMLFVGQPQVAILLAAGRSIELTFLIAVGLLLLSVIPVLYISRYLTRQLK